MPSKYIELIVREVTVFCPICFTWGTVEMRGRRLEKCSHFRQYHGLIYHCSVPCILF